MLTQGPKTLVLVRHAQSTLNVISAKTPAFFNTSEERDSFSETPDHLITLSPLGVTQAAQTGVWLRESGLTFDSLYDSGYVRTNETLNLILEGSAMAALPRKHSINLREREGGYSYTLYKAEIEKEFPWLERYWKTLGPVFARPVGGESVADVISRVELFLRLLNEDERGKKVLIVLHGRIIAAMRYLLEGWSYRELEAFIKAGSPLNCGVTVYEQGQGGALELKSYNAIYY